jgi:nucleoid-associated protein YgaU
VTAILTAWTGFQASKWDGAMSIAFNQASTDRIEAARQEANANRAQTIQVALFTQWLQAEADGNQRLTDFLSTRFPQPLKAAFAAWLATNPRTNPGAPSSPFVMPEYEIPALAAAQAADNTADATFAGAVSDNRQGDNYTLLTVAFASVLFFAAMSGRMKSRVNQWTVLGIGLALFTTATVLLVLLPKNI